MLCCVVIIEWLMYLLWLMELSSWFNERWRTFYERERFTSTGEYDLMRFSVICWMFNWPWTLAGNKLETRYVLSNDCKPTKITLGYDSASANSYFIKFAAAGILKRSIHWMLMRREGIILILLERLSYCCCFYWIGARMLVMHEVKRIYLPRSILRYLLRVCECFRIIFRFEYCVGFVPCDSCFADPFCLNSGNDTWFCFAPSYTREKKRGRNRTKDIGIYKMNIYRHKKCQVFVVIYGLWICDLFVCIRK